MANQMKALKRFVYPFRAKGEQNQLSEPDDFHWYLRAWANAEDGFFALGNNGQWHGGVHFDRATGGNLAQDGGVRCIADGEVIAYRIDTSYPELDFNKGKARYSSGFVLIRHRLQLPPAPRKTTPSAPTTTQPTPQAASGNTENVPVNAASSSPAPVETVPEESSLVFYSLYMHLWDWKSYEANQERVRPGFWESAKDQRLVGDKATDNHPGWGNPTDEQKSQKGINVRKTGKSSPKIGWLPRSTKITIGEIKNQGGKSWGKIVAQDKKESMVKNPEESPASDAPLGWVYMDELNLVAPTPKQCDSVYVLPEPQAIAAGETVGYLGEYMRLQDVKQNVKSRPLLHLEVFAGPDTPAFIKKSRARDKELDKSQKTFLKVEKGAKLIISDDSDITITPQDAFVAVGTPDANLNWVKVEYGKVEEVRRGDLPKLYLKPAYGEGDARRILVEQLEGDKRKVFRPASSAWIKRENFAQGVCVPERDIPAWSRCPLRLESRIKTQEGTFTRVWEIKRLRFTFTDEQGMRWWQVGVNVGNQVEVGFATGWAREIGHPKVSLVSPWDWPGFELLEYEPLSLRERFQWELAGRFPEKWKILEKLYEVIDTSRNRRLERDEIRRAWSQVYIAQILSRLVIDHDSEWGIPVSEWDTLDDLMSKFGPTRDWILEKQRIAKLLWWNDLKGKHGFPQSIRAYHFHPIGVIGTFGGMKRHPKIVLDGESIELEFLDMYDGVALTDADFAEAAQELQCEVAAVKAVALQESGGSFYYQPDQSWDRVPVILYERHKFHNATNGIFDSVAGPEISYPSQFTHGAIPLSYGSTKTSWKRLLKAYQLDKNAALKAASWGSFQILGENHAAAGFSSVEDFVRSFSQSQKNQIKAFVAFIKHNNTLLTAIRNKNWTAFATSYNGSWAIQAGYHTQIAQKYNSITGSQ